jgi:hypothetical protein
MNISIRNKEDKTYLVLGAPHSATSFVAKSLHDQGVDMCVTRRDLYQSRSLMARNDKILKEAGGSWRNPPSEERIMEVTDSYARNFVKRHKGKMWGFKDPRLSLTVKKFLPYLEGDVYMIACFRKPDKIVESYKDLDNTVNRPLVDEYNRRTIDAIKEFVEL